MRVYSTWIRLMKLDTYFLDAPNVFQPVQGSPHTVTHRCPLRSSLRERIYKKEPKAAYGGPGNDGNPKGPKHCQKPLGVVSTAVADVHGRWIPNA